MFTFLMSLFIEEPVKPSYQYQTPIVIEQPTQAVTGTLIDQPIQSIIKEDKIALECLCVAYSRSLGVDVPYNTNADQIEPNSTPTVGSLALFKFSNGVHHVAYIDELGTESFHVQQANKTHCAITEEWIRYDDVNLKGFWSPKLLTF